MTEPKDAGKKPIIFEMEPGTYWWCTCGKTSNEPFCYGTHIGTNFIPMEVKIEEKKRVAWCTCTHSKKKPYCDGSHASL
jgi:CDGSH-type Zn-finger protein